MENKKREIAKFYEQIFLDSKLKERVEDKAKKIVNEEDLRKLIRVEIMPLMRKYNVNFSEEELLEYEEETLKELSEEALESVSGGRGFAIKPLLGLGILSLSIFGGIGLDAFATKGSEKGKPGSSQTSKRGTKTKTQKKVTTKIDKDNSSDYDANDDDDDDSDTSNSSDEIKEKPNTKKKANKKKRIPPGIKGIEQRRRRRNEKNLRKYKENKLKNNKNDDYDDDDQNIKSSSNDSSSDDNQNSPVLKESGSKQKETIKTTSDSDSSYDSQNSKPKNKAIAKKLKTAKKTSSSDFFDEDFDDDNEQISVEGFLAHGDLSRENSNDVAYAAKFTRQNPVKELNVDKNTAKKIYKKLKSLLDEDNFAFSNHTRDEHRISFYTGSLIDIFPSVGNDESTEENDNVNNSDDNRNDNDNANNEAKTPKNDNENNNNGNISIGNNNDNSENNNNDNANSNSNTDAQQDHHKNLVNQLLESSEGQNSIDESKKSKYMREKNANGLAIAVGGGIFSGISDESGRYIITDYYHKVGSTLKLPEKVITQHGHVLPVVGIGGEDFRNATFETLEINPLIKSFKIENASFYTNKNIKTMDCSKATSLEYLEIGDNAFAGSSLESFLAPSHKIKNIVTGKNAYGSQEINTLGCGIIKEDDRTPIVKYDIYSKLSKPSGFWGLFKKASNTIIDKANYVLNKLKSIINFSCLKDDAEEYVDWNYIKDDLNSVVGAIGSPELDSLEQSDCDLLVNAYNLLNLGDYDSQINVKPSKIGNNNNDSNNHGNDNDDNNGGFGVHDNNNNNNNDNDYGVFNDHSGNNNDNDNDDNHNNNQGPEEFVATNENNEASAQQSDNESQKIQAEARIESDSNNKAAASESEDNNDVVANESNKVSAQQSDNENEHNNNDNSSDSSKYDDNDNDDDDTPKKGQAKPKRNNKKSNSLTRTRKKSSARTSKNKFSAKKSGTGMKNVDNGNSQEPKVAAMPEESNNNAQKQKIVSAKEESNNNNQKPEAVVATEENSNANNSQEPEVMANQNDNSNNKADQPKETKEKAKDSATKTENSFSWELTDAGILNISGSGPMPDFGGNLRKFPWYPRNEIIREINISEGITEIPAQAFYNFAKLVNVSLPKSLEAIGVSAFHGCSSLYQVYIPDESQLTSIGKCAFEGCSSLYQVYIPDESQLTSIGKCAFEGCSSLESFISRGAKLTSIEDGTFKGCSKLFYLDIPVESITSIGNRAFGDCIRLKNITNTGGHSHKLTSIGKSAFEGCSNLNYVDMDTVTSIGDYAFYRCESLETFMADNATSIGGYAFRDCKSLKNAIIDNAISIGNGAFWGCESLDSISIPASVTSIGSDAFYDCNNLTEVTINSDAAVGDLQMGFSNCKNIKKITLGKGVTSFDINKLRDFKNLEELAVDEGNEKFTSVDGMLVSKDEQGLTLVYCPQGKAGAITVPGHITQIGPRTFFNCGQLTEVTLENGVKKIEKEAFMRCSAKFVNMPVSLTSISYTGSDGIFNLMLNSNEEIKGNFNKIAARIKKITLGKDVRYMEDDIFANFLYLQAIEVDSNNQDYTSINGVLYSKDEKTIERYPIDKPNEIFFVPRFVTKIEASAFAGSKNLKAVPMPPTVASIGNAAFAESKIASLSIPAAVSEIPEGTFENCKSLKSVHFAEGLRVIGDRAFNGCNNLTSALLPNGLQIIGNNAFNDCIRLTSKSFPDTLKAIGKDAFKGVTYVKGYVPNLPQTYVEEDIADVVEDNEVTVSNEDLENSNLTDQNSKSQSQISNIAAEDDKTPDEGDNKAPDDDEKDEDVANDSKNKTQKRRVKKRKSTTETDEGNNDNDDDEDNNENSSKQKAKKRRFVRKPPTKPKPRSKVKKVIYNEYDDEEEIMDNTSYMTNQTTVPQSKEAAKKHKILGTKVYWQFEEETGTLIFSGSGTIGFGGNVETALTRGIRPWKTGDDIKKIIIQEGINGIDDGIRGGGNSAGMFYKECCPNLKEVEIANSVKKIGCGAFADCYNLEVVKLGTTVTEIGEGAFNNCTSLKSIDIPSTVEIIGDGAFFNCKALEDVEIPSSAKEIEKYAFHGCTSLSYFTFSGDNPQLKTIPTGMFKGCSALSGIVLPPSVKKIESGAFEKNCVVQNRE